ncbi:hypothetical protein DYB32_001925 [Aphanomyces invadans]|uniref:DM10 domain-containing protein n=1 Tax=Aphanomyces invadans TaxID=157072 RepID=A0A418B4R5_9STRA|nr:hypothetical protein DYB32_001925 [Aphanomyces invadans]
MAQIMAGTEDIVAAVAYKPSSFQHDVVQSTTDNLPVRANSTHEPSSRYSATKTLPSWITSDRQVLRFFCYFLDPPSGADDDKSTRGRSHPPPSTTIRRLVLHYYLADASIEVCEPRVVNSGLDQGLFLRRTGLKHPSTSQPYTPSDLVVGASVSIKGRIVTLVDCDAATRDYYTQAKSPQPPALPYPDAPTTSQWDEIERIKLAGKPSSMKFHQANAPLAHHRITDKINSAAKVQQFMLYSNKVLRFYCRWDDPHPLYPASRPFVLHYYLADDTVEVREATKDRGIGKHPVLLSRRRLPYESPHVDAAHVKAASRFVTALDLRCGDVVIVFGRQFYLVDCDEFTRTFYLDYHGITQESQTPPPCTPAVRMDAPEPDDSILQPLLQKSERKKTSTKPRGVDQCLRFRAKLATPTDDIQAKRRFILSFYLLNGTLSIFEPHVPNSGLPGGKFLDRQAYKLHHPLNRFARASDFVVGGTVQLQLTPSQPFELLEADDQTLTYCEDHPDEFPRSNIDLVLRHVVAQLATQSTSLRHVFRAHALYDGTDRPRQLSPDAFDFVLRERLHLSLHPHEDLTLRRRYGRPSSDTDNLVWYDVFCDAVSRTHDAMRRREGNTPLDALRQYHRFLDAVYPCDFSQDDPRHEADEPTLNAPVVPPPVPEDGPLYIPTYRTNLDTARFGVLDPAPTTHDHGSDLVESVSRQRPEQLLESKRDEDDVHSMTSTLDQSTPFTTTHNPSLPSHASENGHSSHALGTSRRGSSAQSTGGGDAPPVPPPISTTPLDQSVSLSRFRTTAQSMHEATARAAQELAQREVATVEPPLVPGHRRNGIPPAPMRPNSTPIELTKEQRAALYKTTSQSMVRSVEKTAALTSQRAADVLARAKAKLLQETKRNPLVSMTVTDVDSVDNSTKALFTSAFGEHKYQLRKALRDSDYDKCGFLEDAFMQALVAIHPDLSDEDRYRIADAFFPSADAQLNYKQLLDVAFGSSAAA